MAETSLKPRNGKQLRAVMYHAGYDTVRLAAAAGVTKQHVSLLLNDLRGCSYTVADRIAQALNLPVSTLFRPTLFEKENNATEIDMPPTQLAPAETDDPILFFPEVANLARMPIGTLRHLRHIGKGPKFLPRGRRLVIRKSDAEAWIRSLETGADS